MTVVTNSEGRLGDALVDWAKETGCGPEECALAVLDAMEMGLGKAISTIDLPPVESTFLERKMEMRRRRVSSRVWEKEQRELSSRKQFLSWLYILQESLNGRTVTRAGGQYPLPEADSPAGQVVGWPLGAATGLRVIHPEPDKSSPPAGIMAESLLSLPNWTREIERDPLFLKGYSLVETEDGYSIPVRTDAKLTSRSRRDAPFRLALDHLQNSLSALVGPLRDLITEADILDWQDVEDPSWKGLIIEFTLQDMPFDKKMEIWDELEKTIRARLKSMRRGMNPKDRREVEKILKSLYIQAAL